MVSCLPTVHQVTLVPTSFLMNWSRLLRLMSPVLRWLDPHKKSQKQLGRLNTIDIKQFEKHMLTLYTKQKEHLKNSTPRNHSNIWSKTCWMATMAWAGWNIKDSSSTWFFLWFVCFFLASLNVAYIQYVHQKTVYWSMPQSILINAWYLTPVTNHSSGGGRDLAISTASTWRVNACCSQSFLASHLDIVQITAQLLQLAWNFQWSAWEDHSGSF